MTQYIDTHSATEGAVITATNVKSFCDEWATFCEHFSDKVSGREPAIYSLPLRFVESLRTTMPNWLAAVDLAFEEEFADLCGCYDAVGVAAGRPVPYGWLTIATQSAGQSEPLTLAAMKWLGWDQFWTLETANRLLNVGADRTEPLRQQLQAFIGWLITNPAFVCERCITARLFTSFILGLFPGILGGGGWRWFDVVARSESGIGAG